MFTLLIYDFGKIGEPFLCSGSNLTWTIYYLFCLFFLVRPSSPSHSIGPRNAERGKRRSTHILNVPYVPNRYERFLFRSPTLFLTLILVPSSSIARCVFSFFRMKFSFSSSVFPCVWLSLTHFFLALFWSMLALFVLCHGTRCVLWILWINKANTQIYIMISFSR